MNDQALSIDVMIMIKNDFIPFYSMPNWHQRFKITKQL